MHHAAAGILQIFNHEHHHLTFKGRHCAWLDMRNSNLTGKRIVKPLNHVAIIAQQAFEAAALVRRGPRVVAAVLRPRGGRRNSLQDPLTPPRIGVSPATATQ